MMSYPTFWSDSNLFTPRTAKKHLDKYQHHLKWNSDESIIECGIGDGKISQYVLHPILPSSYKELILTDISPKMVEYAKANVTIPNTEVSVFDVCEKVPDEYIARFDHCFGFFIMHLLQTPQEVRQGFKNMYKILKPGGQIFHNFLKHVPVDPVFDNLLKHPKWKKYGKMISAYYYTQNPEDEYRRDLEEAGFKNVVFTTEQEYHEFRDEDMANEFFIAVNAVLPNIPKEDQDEYLNCYWDVCKKVNSIKFKIVDGKRIPYFNLIVVVVVATKPL